MKNQNQAQAVINSAELAREVSRVLLCADHKSPHPFVGLIQLRIRDGIWLGATNFETSMQSRIKCETKGEALVGVPAKRLHSVCSVLPPGDVVLKISNQLAITSKTQKNRSYKIVATAADAAPKLPAPSSDNFMRLDSAALKKAIGAVEYVIETGNQAKFDGVLIDCKDKKLTAVTFSGKTMAVSTVDSSGPSSSVFVPRGALKSLVALLSQDSVELCSEAAYLFARSGDVQLSISQPREFFEKWREVLSQISGSKSICSFSSLAAQEILRALIVAGDEGRDPDVVMELDEFLSFAVSGDQSNSSDCMPVESRGAQGRTVRLSGKALMGALRGADAIVTWSAADGRDQPAIFSSENFRALVMPLVQQ